MKRRVVIFAGSAILAAAFVPSFLKNREDGPVEVVESPLFTDPDGTAFVYRNGWIEKI